MSAFRLVSERLVHTGAVVSFAVGTFEGPGGLLFDRDIVHHPGAVSVVPVTDSGEVLLVRQFRAALGTDLLEIVAGKRDVSDEPLEETAQRELAEEVGMRAGRLDPLVSIAQSPGFCDEINHLFLATDLAPVERDHQGIEEQHMSVEAVPLEQVRELIAAGELCDAKSLVGLLMVLDRLGR